MVNGYWLLVIGYWLLVIGYWLLVIGYWLLVIVAKNYGFDIADKRMVTKGEAMKKAAKLHQMRRRR